MSRRGARVRYLARLQVRLHQQQLVEWAAPKFEYRPTHEVRRILAATMHIRSSLAQRLALRYLRFCQRALAAQERSARGGVETFYDAT